ncbi:MAG: SpoIIE family protein phosphatase [Phycisphaerales bacterium]
MGIRWKLILVVALPLLALLAVMVAVDYSRLRDEALLAARTRLAEVAERHAATLDGRLRSLAQIARSTASVLEADPGLTEAELYDLLQRNVEADALVVGSGVAFQPGAFVRPRGVAASALPEAEGDAVRAPRPGEFAPLVFRPPAGTAVSSGVDLEGARVPLAKARASGMARTDVALRLDYTRDDHAWFAVPRGTGKAVWTNPQASLCGAVVSGMLHGAPFFREGRFAGAVVVEAGVAELIEATIGPGVRVHAPGDRPAASDQPRTGEVPSISVLTGVTAAGSISHGLAPEGPAVAGSAAVPGAGWTVLVSRARDDVMAAVHETVRKRVLDGVIFVGAAVVIVLSFSTWLVRPLRRLSRAVRGLSVDQLSAGTPASGVEGGRGDEVAELSRAFSGMVGKLHGQVEEMQRRAKASEGMETESRLAREIQASLLPTVFPQRADLDVFALGEAARFVGGDFFDVFLVGPDRLAVVIADVSGKGVPAAMLMAVTRTLLRELVLGGALPGAALHRANNLLFESNPEALFVTLFLGVYDAKTGELVYANAGHPSPLRARADGGCEEIGAATGTVLGAMPDLAYGEGVHSLQPGETLVLFTDGVSEARDAQGLFLGTEGLARLCNQTAGAGPRALCERVAAEARRHQGGVLRDDLTVLALKRSVGGAVSTGAAASGTND